jgi:site-specific recombinase XerD
MPASNVQLIVSFVGYLRAERGVGENTVASYETDVRKFADAALQECAKPGEGLDPAKWHPHLLRHACGTHMHDHNAPLQAVATFLGHAKLSTAQIYTRVSVGRMMQTYKAAHPHAR